MRPNLRSCQGKTYPHYPRKITPIVRRFARKRCTLVTAGPDVGIVSKSRVPRMARAHNYASYRVVFAWRGVCKTYRVTPRCSEHQPGPLGPANDREHMRRILIFLTVVSLLSLASVASATVV